MNYYDFKHTTKEVQLLEQFYNQTGYLKEFAQPYFVESAAELFNKLKKDCTPGITATAGGFYGPQGRILRIPLKENQLNEKLRDFKMDSYRITNFEMESSGLYGLSRALGHNACTICAIIANRFSGDFSNNYQKPITKLIEKTLSELTD